MKLSDFRFYNELAEKYPESTVVYKDARAIYRERFLSEILSTRKGLTLDIGCNDGRYAKYVEGEYVGIDPGLACLRRFKNRRVWAIVEHLPFKDEAFDYVLLFETLEHIWERTLVLAECRRVLRRGGELIVSAPYGDNPWDIVSVDLTRYGIEKYEYLHGGFNESYLKTILVADFKIVAMKILTYTMEDATRSHKCFGRSNIIAIAKKTTRAVTPKR